MKIYKVVYKYTKYFPELYDTYSHIMSTEMKVTSQKELFDKLLQLESDHKWEVIKIKRVM
nr:MAG TPA: hypothetical protein [Caudoviricetes sp.]